jgi:hypothetical protein
LTNGVFSFVPDIIYAIYCCRWAPEVQNIFYQGNKRKLVPSNQDQPKLEHFFNCAATMMTEQLQNLALDSVADFIDMLIQPPVCINFTSICLNHAVVVHLKNFAFIYN